MSRRIIGNLDCESDFARFDHVSCGPLPRQVLVTISGAATLLRALARDEDRLWLPAELRPETMAAVPGLAKPILESGPLTALDGADAILAWGETATVAALRSGAVDQTAEDGALSDFLWSLPTPSPEVAARVNHRGVCLALAKEIGCQLSHAAMLDSVDDLTAHLELSEVCAWVLKAPFSAAGRWRIIHRGGPLMEGFHRRIERLFQRHGTLLFEPWMERTADFGVSAAITHRGLRIAGLHRLEVDSIGRFIGVELRLIEASNSTSDPWLSDGERSLLDSVAHHVGAALAEMGYRGPFGIDCWRYIDASGRERFHPLGEINGRLTFGWVARCLAETLRDPLHLSPDDRLRLVFGQQPPDAASHRVVVLFATSRPTPQAIWLEIAPAHH